MSSDSEIQLIPDDEQLSRFILIKGWIRSDSNTVKSDAFIPQRDLNLSVTACSQLSENDIWRVGQEVAQNRPDGTLRGRADILSLQVRQRLLQVISHPVQNNPNHVHITGWLSDKPAQKSIAQELTDAARFIPNPTLVISQEE